MKNILITFSLLFAFVFSSAQTISHSAGITYGTGAPTHTPNGTVSKVYFDVTNVKLYDWSGSAWKVQGEDIDRISGCAAPNYVPGLGDSHLALNGCTTPFTPQLYAFVGPLASNWVLISGYNAGEGINIANGTISLGVLDRVRFSQNPSLAGGERIIRWNDTDGTLEFGMKGGNVTQQIGQESSFLVKHADNLPLVEGRVVYLAGSTGQNKTVRYAHAISEATSSTTFGVMTESATSGGTAFCTTFGYVRDINTSNLKEGGLVWLSASVSPDSVGALTAVKPTPPNHGVLIGLCVRKHANQGIIYVSIQNGYELDELHDVYISNLKNKQVIAYDSLQLRWENMNLKTLVDQAVGVASVTGKANKLAYFSTDSTLVFHDSLHWDPVNKRFGINVIPSLNFQVDGGDARFQNDAPMRLEVVNQNPAIFPTVSYLGSNNTFGYVGTQSNNEFKILSNGNPRIEITTDGRVGVNTSGGPVIGAQFEVTSTNGGFLPPRMTTSQRDNINTPNDGLIIYNLSTNKLQVRANGLWVDLH
jgi:hypothetical protein